MALFMKINICIIGCGGTGGNLIARRCDGVCISFCNNYLAAYVLVCRINVKGCSPERNFFKPVVAYFPCSMVVCYAADICFAFIAGVIMCRDNVQLIPGGITYFHAFNPLALPAFSALKGCTP